jgi:hypothetical protein
VKKFSSRKVVRAHLKVATRTAVAGGVASAMMFLGLSAFVASPAFAVGTASNTIVVYGPPDGASIGGYYVPNAKATSGDVVVLALDPTSTGCSVAGGKVSFTSAGECVINFSDPGNATYAAAAGVTQSIRIDAENIIAIPNTTTAGSVEGTYTPDASVTSGDVVRVSLAATSTGCTLRTANGTVTFIMQGTCRILLNDPGNGAYAAAPQVTRNVTIYVANILKTSVAPVTAVINSSYQASATASSKDPVVITIDPLSEGCGIVVQRVTFSSDGLCRIDFNDPGNGAFTAAKQVQQIVKIGSGAPNIQAPLYITSLNAVAGRTLALKTSGGTGIGAVTFTASPGSANCSIRNGVLSYSHVGLCTVTAKKASDATYLASITASATIRVNLASSPFAIRVSSPVTAGHTQETTILGAGFYGVPRIVSSVATTKVTVVSASGTRLVVRVFVANSTPRGLHTLTLTFAHGQRTSVTYTQH